MSHDVAFVLTLIPGPMEARCLLAVEGIRTFGGFCSHAPIWVVQPRGCAAPSALTQVHLQNRDVHYLRANLNDLVEDRESPQVHPTDEAAAAAHVEGLLSGYVGVLCHLRRDTVLIGPPAEIRLGGSHQVALACIGSQGPMMAPTLIAARPEAGSMERGWRAIQEARQRETGTGPTSRGSKEPDPDTLLCRSLEETIGSGRLLDLGPRYAHAVTSVLGSDVEGGASSLEGVVLLRHASHVDAGDWWNHYQMDGDLRTWFSEQAEMLSGGSLHQ